MTVIDLNAFRYQRTATPMSEVPRNLVLAGDATTRLRELPPASVDCVVTSPPYHLLRRYGGGPDEIGSEPHVEAYVNRLIEVIDEIARVIKPTGNLWLNLGDSYSRGQRYGAPAKSLLLAPERVLLALAERDWVCRNKVIWAKSNPMPHSVRDRLSCTWEPVFHLTRQGSYFYDIDAVRVPASSQRKPSSAAPAKYTDRRPSWAGPLAGSNDGLDKARREGRASHPLGRNPGDVWRIATAGYREAHFAVYPERLIELPITATCPERACEICGQPWQRRPRRDRLGEITASCGCDAGWRPGLVLDPFIGAGTTAVVATRLGRDWLGIELNPSYVTLTRNRLEAAA